MNWLWTEAQLSLILRQTKAYKHMHTITLQQHMQATPIVHTLNTHTQTPNPINSKLKTIYLQWPSQKCKQLLAKIYDFPEKKMDQFE